MGLECGWRHAQKRWVENLKVLKTRQLRNWDWTMQANNWVLCHLVEFFSVAATVKFFRVSTSEDELRSKTPRDVSNVGGVVSIIWYERLFKNRVSLLVSKNRSQKLINLSYLNTGVACVFVFACVSHLYWTVFVNEFIPLHWYHYGCECTTLAF